MQRIAAPSFIGGLILALACSPARADVQPHGIFTDNAVLQQGIRVPVWGTASDGEQVTVRFRDQEVSTRADGGQWMVRLRPMRAGGPFTLTASGKNTVEFKNVMVGEVWVASGQSNMEWPMTLSANPQESIAKANDPQIRLFTVKKATSDSPVRTLTGQWQECRPETVASFSAVAYYFGRDLRKALNVPVGLINTSWGGTVAEAWTGREMLESDPELRSLWSDYRRAKLSYPLSMMAHQQALEEHRLAAEKAKQEGRQPPMAPRPPFDPNNAGNPNRPSVLYNAMIVPLQPYAIRGAIWYQGESNAGRAHQYQTLFPAMIRNWREAWGQGEFPFLFVQLAPFMAIQQEPQESAWAELREAQRLTALRLPNTGMAVITDAGDERDIHPKDKETVGGRLARIALSNVYGQEVDYSGPAYRSMKVQGDRAILSFRHIGGGLVAKGDKLTGFTIAGKDGKWHNAEAEIRGNTVVVHSPQVPEPVAVRYGWANFPLGNLWSKAGLPASPFRTDEFTLTTQKR